jgi:hypothetical protein
LYKLMRVQMGRSANTFSQLPQTDPNNHGHHILAIIKNVIYRHLAYWT